MPKQERGAENKKIEGVYSHLLPPPDSHYAVGRYEEEGSVEECQLAQGKPVVEGREYDSEGNLRRFYFVDAAGEILEVQEFNAHVVDNDERRVERTFIKNGNGEFLGVEASTVDKKKQINGHRWEWLRENNSGEWDPKKLENEE